MYLKINSDSEILPDIWSEFHSILCTLVSYEEAVKTISPLIIQIFRSQEDFLDTSLCQDFYSSHYSHQTLLFQNTSTWVDRDVSISEGTTSRNKCQLLKVSPQIIRTLQMVK